MQPCMDRRSTCSTIKNSICGVIGSNIDWGHTNSTIDYLCNPFEKWLGGRCESKRIVEILLSPINGNPSVSIENAQQIRVSKMHRQNVRPPQDEAFSGNDTKLSKVCMHHQGSEAYFCQSVISTWWCQYCRSWSQFVTHYLNQFTIFLMDRECDARPERGNIPIRSQQAQNIGLNRTFHTMEIIMPTCSICTRRLSNNPTRFLACCSLLCSDQQTLQYGDSPSNWAALR
jgi:hypothetical protein